MLSLVINTAALETGPRTSSAGTPLADRAYALRTFVLPAYIRSGLFADIIVVGSWEPPAAHEYVYIECPSLYGTCADALIQRDIGVRAARGSWIICQHDDHLLDVDSVRAIDWDAESADVLSPRRSTRLRRTLGEPLNDGRSAGYILGHCAAYRRAALERCPWGSVPPTFTWDIGHTDQLVRAGFRVVWSDVLHVEDIEQGGTPWR